MEFILAVRGVRGHHAFLLILELIGFPVVVHIIIVEIFCLAPLLLEYAWLLHQTSI